jgi:hypothetical protein
VIGTLAVIDFINAREKAALVWAAAILILTLVKSDGFVGSLGVAVRAFFARKLLIAFGSAALYSAVVLWIANDLGLWHLAAAKASVYWFFGTGVVLVSRAIASSPDAPIPWGKYVHEGLKFSIVVDFVINLYVLPFAAELLLVPLIFLFVGTLAIEPKNPLIIRILLAINFFLFAYVSERVIADSSGFFSRETVEDFLVAPVLSFALFPVLGAIAWYSRRELRQLRARWPAFNLPG